MLAWKVACWYGLDRWLLPLVGTPWYRGQITGAIPLRPWSPVIIDCDGCSLYI
jgi:hypothetical protein